MCRFAVTFTNQQGWRVVVYCNNPNWFGIEEEGRKALDKAKEHGKYGPWTYSNATRVG